jgi:hypothetical protein
MKILKNPIIHIANAATVASGQAFVSDRYFYIMENTEEIWKDIAGYEGLYQVSNLGNIMSFQNKTPKSNKAISKLLKPALSPRYYQVDLCLKGKKRRAIVHREVAIAFIPNPLNKPCVNHINGIRTDNRVENLEWCTSSENRIHAFETGLAKVLHGINHGMCKLTNEQVLKIRELSLSGMSSYKIAKEIEIVSPKQIRNIISRKRWNHI